MTNPTIEPEQFAVVTQLGAAKLNALVIGQTLTISTFALGDGAGNEVVPNVNGTRLINEIGREPITAHRDDYFAAGIFMSSEMAGKYKGKWLREVGLYDDDGDLIVWGSIAPTLISLFTERDLMVHLPLDNRDKITITVDTTRRYITKAEFDALKEEMLASIRVQDYSQHALQLADPSHPIYATLPRSVMAIIPVGAMGGINDGGNYPLFTPRDDIGYVLFVHTYYAEIGFEQTLTIIEQSSNKHDANMTFKRSGQSFVDANVWSSMVGLPPNQSLVVDTLYFRNDVRAIDM